MGALDVMPIIDGGTKFDYRCLISQIRLQIERCTMFQLFDLIMTSPVGVFVGGAVQDVIYAALIVSDCDECGFNDLGKLLFGGMFAAIIVGVVVSILLRRA